MAARALLYLGETSSKCAFSNLRYTGPRLHAQTSWKNVRGFKRGRDTTKRLEDSFSNSLLETGPAGSTKLFKAIGFTVAIGGASFVTASICEYERMRRYTHWIIDQYHSATQKRLARSGWRAEAERWWRSLTDGERVFVPICFLNVVVFFAWKIPALKGTMMRYFCASPSSSVICWPMLLSTFSHYSALHLAANMYVLHSFGTIAVSTLGKEQFVAFYLTSGVVASLASHIYKVSVALPGLSLGASGAVMGVIGFISTQYPETMLAIAFLPMLKFTAGNAIKCIMAIDTLGCFMKWKFVDHAAHLGGALYGIFWQLWGNSNIWQKREPIVKYWHNIRQPPSTS